MAEVVWPLFNFGFPTHRNIAVGFLCIFINVNDYAVMSVRPSASIARLLIGVAAQIVRRNDPDAFEEAVSDRRLWAVPQMTGIGWSFLKT